MFDFVPSSWPTLSRSLLVLGIIAGGVLSASTLSHWRARRPASQISLLAVLGGLLLPRALPRPQSPSSSKHHAVDRQQLLTEFADTMDPLPATRHRCAPSVREQIKRPERDRPDLSPSGGPLPRANSSLSMPPPPRPSPGGHRHSHSSSTSVACDTTLSQPAPMPLHARSMSHADATTRQNKRLSLNFPVPVQPASPVQIPTPRRARPASWIGTTPVRPEPFQPSLASPPPDGNFFTALAAQERRVLELKEELAKAEDRLRELKKQWANQEAARKGQKEGYGFHPLQPINTNLANLGIIDDDPEGPSWMQKEMERRRAILTGQRSSNRKVFSGSRHTRTLSLLSPDKTVSDASFSKSAEKALDDIPASLPLRGRSSTTPDTTNDHADQADQRDALVRTGKQMASDFKDGLWTFLEDLRQATVGDEAVNGTSTRSGAAHQVRRQPSGANIGSSSATSLGRSKSMGHARKPKSLQPSGDGSTLIDIETDFWKEHGIEAPKPAVVKPTKSSTTPQKPSQNFEESWEDWDTPPNNDKFVPGHSSTNSSVSEGRNSQCSDGSSPRTSTSSVPGLAPLDLGKVREAKRSSMGPSSPWRALSKLSPSNVKRAASNFMDEWEKSITSPIEGSMAEAEALQDYLYSMASSSKDNRAE